MNNLFAKATKELVTDAFLAWIFAELENDKNLSKFKVHFLNELQIKDISENICITQTQLQADNTDLIVSMKDTHSFKKILFENKTWTTIHSDQLNKYKLKFPNCHQYIYMKLAYIDFQERMEAFDCGYTVIGAKEIESAIRPFKDYSQIISQYYQYIKHEFIDYPINFYERMQNNDSLVYGERQPQRMFLSELHESLHDQLDYLYFKSGTNNNGTPWTHLEIAKKDTEYGDKNEYIFWRIDKKSGRYYIRLNQYSNINQSKSDEKNSNLISQREIFNELLTKCKLKASKPSNRGVKNSEIGLFYFDKNSYLELQETLVWFSKEFVEKY